MHSIGPLHTSCNCRKPEARQISQPSLRFRNSVCVAQGERYTHIWPQCTTYACECICMMYTECAWIACIIYYTHRSHMLYLYQDNCMYTLRVLLQKSSTTDFWIPDVSAAHCCLHQCNYGQQVLFRYVLTVSVYPVACAQVVRSYPVLAAYCYPI